MGPSALDHAYDLYDAGTYSYRHRGEHVTHIVHHDFLWFGPVHSERDGPPPPHRVNDSVGGNVPGTQSHRIPL